MQQELFDQETTDLIEQEAELLKQISKMEHQLFLLKQKQIKLKTQIRRKLRSKPKRNNQRNDILPFKSFETIEMFKPLERNDNSEDFNIQKP